MPALLTPPCVGASAFASYQGAVMFMQSAVAKALASGDARAAAQARGHPIGLSGLCRCGALCTLRQAAPWWYAVNLLACWGEKPCSLPYPLQETASAAAQLYAQFYSSGGELAALAALYCWASNGRVGGHLLSWCKGALFDAFCPTAPPRVPEAADQAGAFWAMLGQAVQADAGRACGSPAAAARLAQAVANAPMVMASAGESLRQSAVCLALHAVIRCPKHTGSSPSAPSCCSSQSCRRAPSFRCWAPWASCRQCASPHRSVVGELLA